ncbi:MAG: NUDIX hydrolase [Bacteroidetes bacterium]|nr:NUDIX hydrolase [Bacteroidota bacterium]
MSFITLLEEYTPFDETESQMRDEIITFVKQYPNYMDRTLEVGHITGSAWILDENKEYALLTHHHGLNRWFQLGGHGEGETNVKDIAIREAKEESGLESIRLVSENIFSLDVHFIPESKSFPRHKHFDLRFLFFADKNEPLQISEESNELKWILLDDIHLYNSDPALMRMVSKSKQLKT